MDLSVSSAQLTPDSQHTEHDSSVADSSAHDSSVAHPPSPPAIRTPPIIDNPTPELKLTPMTSTPLFRAWDDSQIPETLKRHTDDSSNSAAKRRRLEDALDKLKASTDSPTKRLNTPSKAYLERKPGNVALQQSVSAIGDLLSRYVTGVASKESLDPGKQIIQELRIEIKNVVEEFLMTLLQELLRKVNRGTNSCSSNGESSSLSSQRQFERDGEKLESPRRPNSTSFYTNGDVRSDEDSETENFLGDQDSPLSLVLPSKRKRTKVTDTRLSTKESPLSHKQDDNQNPVKSEASSPTPLIRPPPMYFPPTGNLFNLPYMPGTGGPAPSLMRPSPYPSLSNYWGHLNYLVGMQYGSNNCLNRMPVGPENTTGPASTSEDTERDGTPTAAEKSPSPRSGQQSSTALSPLHLRKAKLMFFYVRYPSSGMLRAFYPDVRFDKHTTAQIVKWFSNFREFFYGVIERYARELSGDSSAAQEVVISEDSELYRTLCAHYNRNSRIKVPERFRGVAQATVREFQQAIQSGKDKDPAWKKHIYKIIARYDDPLPEYFKSVDWMQKLADG